MEIKRKNFYTKIFVIFLVISVVTSIVPIGVSAKAKIGSQTYVLTDYASEDVSAVNSIITNNGLTGYSQNDPASWDFVTWTSTVPKRVETFDFTGKVLSGDLSLTGLSGLESLDIYGQNSLNSITVNGMTALTHFNVHYCNNLKELTLKNVQTIDNLYIASNMNLEMIDLGNLPNLSKIHINSNQKIKEISIVGFPDLDFLKILSNSSLERVRLSNLSKLGNFYVETSPKLTQFEVSEMSSLYGIHLFDLPKLEALSLNGQTDGLPKLEYIVASKCGFKTIEMTDFPELLRLSINYNKISSLKLVNLPQLDNLYISENELTEIDIRHLPTITSLTMHSNKVYDISKIPSTIGHVSAEYQKVTRTFYTNNVHSGTRSIKLPTGTVILKGRDGIANNVKNGNSAYNSSRPDTITANFSSSGNMVKANIGELESVDGSISSISYIINLIAFVGVTGDNLTVPAETSENINCRLTSDLLPGYTPTFTFEQVSGEEYFTIDDSGRVTGMEAGEGKVKIIASTKEDTSLRSETIVDVTITKEEPDVDNPDVDNPDVDNPDVDNPDDKTPEEIITEEDGSEESITEDNGAKGVTTGDESQMTQWIVTGGFAFALIAFSYITKKKKEQ